MNRKIIFRKICNKLDQDKAVLAEMICQAVPGDEFFFGIYRLVYNGMDKAHDKQLYFLSLYKNNALETRVLADIE